MDDIEYFDKLEREAEAWRKSVKTKLSVEIYRDDWPDEQFNWTIILDDEPATLADDVYKIVDAYAKAHGLQYVDHG